MRVRLAQILLPGLLLPLLTASAGVTLEDFRAMPKLTPSQFARHFKDFKFEPHRDVQPAESFLAAGAGDADDFAILAARILGEKGYTPRLISVRLPRVTHVVCYIEETGSYLDYSCRSHWLPMVRSGAGLDEIAAKVARSYGVPWSSASEFIYEDGVKRLVKTVLGKASRGMAQNR